MRKYWLGWFFLVLLGCQMRQNQEKTENILARTIELQQNNITEAIQYLCRKNIYQSLDLLEALAFLYEENNETLLAAQTFEQLFHADIDKSFPESAFYAAQIYAQLQLWSSAERCYRLFLDCDPENVTVWFTLSEIESKQGNTYAALTSYLNGLSVSKVKTKQNLFKLAQLCLQNNMLDAAEFWGELCLQKDATNKEVLILLLKIADLHNDRDQVQKFIQTLEAIQPDFLKNQPNLREKYMLFIPQKMVDEDEAKPAVVRSTEEEILNTVRIFFPVDILPKPFVFPRIKQNLCQPYIY